MKREEILARSRAEGKDEMVLAVHNRAYYWGTMALLAACVFFIGVKLIAEGVFAYDIPALIFALNTGKYFYDFLVLKARKSLVIACLCLFVFVGLTILYFINR